MAASSSPVAGSINETGPIKSSTPPRRTVPLDAFLPKQSLRGLNKPKCFHCGNVARSRCPYQSCKSCCAKAQNPCHIHVLKGNSTFSEKSTASGSPLLKQPSKDASPSVASSRFSSLRQLSNNFSQFNGAQHSLKARRPLSCKDAAAINAWRFSKLKEYDDRNKEAETEAFERYMQNVSLLEEAFSVSKSLDVLARDGLHIPDVSTLTSEDESQKLILGMKAKLKSNVERADECRQRIEDLIDRGLRKLQKWEPDDEGDSTDVADANGEREVKKPKKTEKWQDGRTTAINDLLDKLNEVQSAEELKACLQMKLQLFDQNEEASGKSDSHQGKDAQMSVVQNDGDASLPRQECDLEMPTSLYSLPKSCTMVEINQEHLSNVDIYLSSNDQMIAL